MKRLITVVAVVAATFVEPVGAAAKVAGKICLRVADVEGDKPVRRAFKKYLIGYFHIVIAEVRTEEGKLHLFVAIGRTSQFAFAQLHEKATWAVAADVARALIAAVTHKIINLL